MILLSTNMYNNENFQEALHFVEKYPQIGLELFPLWNTTEYDNVMEKYKAKWSQVPNSIHEQYYESEHAVDERDEKYGFTMESTEKAIELAKELNSRYIVYHYNNMVVSIDKREEMLTITRKNLAKVNALAKEAGVEFVIENVGVASHNNVIFNEQEFIDECLSQPNNVLIDIGHAWANGWNLEHVMDSLKDKIIAYHIHNNDGHEDSHQRIHNGTLDFDAFLEWYKKYTPNADLVLEYAANVRDDVAGIEADIEELLARGV